jgi:putative transposase
LGAVIGGYKSAVTRTVNEAFGTRAPIVWQGRFHDHIIRNERELNYIREYILTNPTRWAEDTFHPSHQL